MPLGGMITYVEPGDYDGGRQLRLTDVEGEVIKEILV